MHLKTLALTAVLLLVPGAVQAQVQATPPEVRPDNPTSRYMWDVVCLAADQWWQINDVRNPTEADKRDSLALMKAAEDSAAAVGKDFQAMSDQMLTIFSALLAEPTAFYGMRPAQLRTHCLRLLRAA